MFGNREYVIFQLSRKTNKTTSQNKNSNKANIVSNELLHEHFSMYFPFRYRSAADKRNCPYNFSCKSQMHPYVKNDFQFDCSPLRTNIRGKTFDWNINVGII